MVHRSVHPYFEIGVHQGHKVVQEVHSASCKLVLTQLYLTPSFWSVSVYIYCSVCKLYYGHVVKPAEFGCQTQSGYHSANKMLHHDIIHDIHDIAFVPSEHSQQHSTGRPETDQTTAAGQSESSSGRNCYTVCFVMIWLIY